jgi:hypothetical protein
MPRILTKLRIDEVSAVTKGAGAGTRIVIMKRDDSDVIAKATAALAESVASIVDLDQDKADAINETLTQFRDYLTKSAGDADRDDGDSVQRFSQMFSSPKQAERALACIIAARSRLRKSDDAQDNLHDIAKECGVVAVAKAIADGGSYGISEQQLVELIGNHDRRDGESTAKCFARHFEAPTEDGAAIRKAIEITKAAEIASLTPIVTDGNTDNSDDARKATEALNRLVADQRARFPWKSAERAWDDAMRENPDLAERAIPRPEPVSIYPMPR